MDYHFYNKLGVSNHWWFDSKDDLIKMLMKQYCESKPSIKNSLDFGGGVATEFGTCLDINKKVAKHNKSFYNVDVENKKALQRFKNYNYVVISELLEHLDDEKVVDNIKKCLKKGGKVFATVPAMMQLWSKHDVEMEHRKRYTVDELKQLFESKGFKTLRIGYWNHYMLPFVWAMKKLDKGGIRKTNRLFDKAFRAILGFETKRISKGVTFNNGATAFGVFQA